MHCWTYCPCAYRHDRVATMLVFHVANKWKLMLEENRYIIQKSTLLTGQLHLPNEANKFRVASVAFSESWVGQIGSNPTVDGRNIQTLSIRYNPLAPKVQCQNQTPNITTPLLLTRALKHRDLGVPGFNIGFAPQSLNILSIYCSINRPF